MNKEYFIKKAQEIHGNKYDYSLVEVSRSKDKVNLFMEYLYKKQIHIYRDEVVLFVQVKNLIQILLYEKQIKFGIINMIILKQSIRVLITKYVSYALNMENFGKQLVII